MMCSHLSFLLGYLDPGTGAIVLQVVVAAFLSAGVIFRRVLFAPIAAVIGRGKKAEDEQSDGESEPESS